MLRLCLAKKEVDGVTVKLTNLKEVDLNGKRNEFNTREEAIKFYNDQGGTRYTK